ncbi:MAG TPA: sulfurtransferase [Bacteroidota bacterium]|nr:sulfurtransferase [Bacteroidota bacterium]
MKTIITAALFALLADLPVAAQDGPAVPQNPYAPGGAEGIIVNTSWVSKRLIDPSLVLLHVGDRGEYDSLHLPGARFISTREISAPSPEGSLSLELPAVEFLDSVFEAKGVSDRSTIVIYPGNDWFTPSARVWLTLDYLGFSDHVHLMDGGMTAWKAEGKPLTAEIPALTPGSFTPHPRNDVVVSKSWVYGKLKDPKVALIDARNPVYYTGQDTGNASRPGHIPGAKNLPFDSMVDSTNHFRAKSEIIDLFKTAGMDRGKTAVSYCHIGQQASLLYVMARVSGFEVRMYDGSMQEWTADPDMPVVVEKK